MILQSERLCFKAWEEDDLPLAYELWGNPQVTRYISASGIFTNEQIEVRFRTERENQKQHGISYMKVYAKETGVFLGVCGLRPHGENSYEAGIHFLPHAWGKGFGAEAMQAVINYAFEQKHAAYLFAGHNPKNERSRKLLQKAGFVYQHDEYYAPTGLMHPSYIVRNPKE